MTEIRPVIPALAIPILLAIIPAVFGHEATKASPNPTSTTIRPLYLYTPVATTGNFPPEASPQQPNTLIVEILFSVAAAELSSITQTVSERPSPPVLGSPAAAAAQQAATALVEKVTAEQDPASESFMGQVPNATIDLPLTIVFLLLFAAAAFTHISIYRNNAKRGHKFLLSDVIFDFCMIRTLTCIFRIIWVFVNTRGIILVALIFENGGAAVLFAVNIFFVQRLVRSIQPHYGWNPIFGYVTLTLAFSVPAVIILNIVSLSVSFFSVGNEVRLGATKGMLIFGASWNVFLVNFPMMALFAACVVQGPKPEPFGIGQFRTKAAILLFGAAALSIGAALRLAAIVNPQPPDSSDVLYSKALFYMTGFLLEILVVALYAVGRVDLLFHIPDASAGPGDYARGSAAGAGATIDVEGKLLRPGVPYEVIGAGAGGADRLLVTFSTTLHGLPSGEPPQASEKVTEKELPPRPDRVSRRTSLMTALRPQRPPQDGRDFPRDEQDSRSWIYVADGTRP
ncbi:hypothetical protein QBC46DRAFT_368664 [Diplogelasinospora grovesii]|uniref:Uncharacterized protein n=1 Tax=Diplogelasinospora grovesii TaxID=303347 RepID=A0AAN6MXA3_9PEZI|nr:hypothetical protein QBC46DRAFT_368664 [Diplogelasinospora grovesii]